PSQACAPLLLSRYLDPAAEHPRPSQFPQPSSGPEMKWARLVLSHWAPLQGFPPRPHVVVDPPTIRMAPDPSALESQKHPRPNPLFAESLPSEAQDSQARTQCPSPQ